MAQLQENLKSGTYTESVSYFSLRVKKVESVFMAASGTTDITIADLTPIARIKSTGLCNTWAPPVNQVNTITANATPSTAGTFTITVNGVTTGTIAYNATAATVQAAVAKIVGPGNVLAVATTGANLGVASAVVTLTFVGDYAGRAMTVSATMTGLTGNVHVLAETTAGVNSDGRNIIIGFAWGEQGTGVAQVQDDTAETRLFVITEGSIEYSDIPLVNSATATQLKEALRNSGLREKQLVIESLNNRI